MSPADSVAQRVRGIVAEVSRADPLVVTGPARLAEDLGFDSLRLIELAVALEAEFLLGEVDEATMLDIVTVGDVEQAVLALTDGTS
jgi:acyl carrier protein